MYHHTFEYSLYLDNQKIFIKTYPKKYSKLMGIRCAAGMVVGNGQLLWLFYGAQLGALEPMLRGKCCVPMYLLAESPELIHKFFYCGQSPLLVHSCLKTL